MAKIIGAEPLYDYEAETKVYVPGRQDPRIVIIGGGHGQSNALRGLKRLSKNLTGIVAVSDDGGGSGVIREDLGILPPGDIRNCILALSNAEPILKKLLDHRFESGSLQGQSFGNLFLAAMTAISGSFDEAVMRMCEVLSVTGKVLPVTTENVFLEASFENGETIRGESQIFLAKRMNDCRIQEIRMIPEHPKALHESVTEILNADIVLIGPGSLYTSVIPNFLVDGITEALAETKALRIFVMNVMTQEGETEGYTGYDHIRAFIDHAAPGVIDVCLANNQPVEGRVLEAYRKEDSTPIELCRKEIEELGIRVVERPLLKEAIFARHDPEKLADAIHEIYKYYQRKK